MATTTEKALLPSRLLPFQVPVGIRSGRDLIPLLSRQELAGFFDSGAQEDAAEFALALLNALAR